jgi:hypothetical protein
MTDDSKLVRAAAHEAAHAALAAIHSLPLRDVVISPDGSGLTRYARAFTVAEASAWVTVTLAGAEGEMLLCDCNSAPSDIAVISRMTRQMGIRFPDLEAHRHRCTRTRGAVPRAARRGCRRASTPAHHERGRDRHAAELDRRTGGMGALSRPKSAEVPLLASPRTARKEGGLKRSRAATARRRAAV